MDDTPERALAALEKYGGWYGVLRALEDAERYRWLRSRLVNWCPDDGTARLSWHARECLDAEIDAAMAGANT